MRSQLGAEIAARWWERRTPSCRGCVRVEADDQKQQAVIVLKQTEPMALAGVTEAPPARV